jgi:hypothetical protein
MHGTTISIAGGHGLRQPYFAAPAGVHSRHTARSANTVRFRDGRTRQASAAAQLPKFALIISDGSGSRWRPARLVRDHENLDFYVKAISVRWPFALARATADVRPDKTGFGWPAQPPQPAPSCRRLRVTWRWEPDGQGGSCLPFFVKRVGPAWLARLVRPSVRVTLKDMTPAQRRITLKI